MTAPGVTARRRWAVGHGEQSRVVLADPEGSEFCVPASLMGSRASLRSSRRRSAAALLELVERRSTWAELGELRSAGR